MSDAPPTFSRPVPLDQLAAVGRGSDRRKPDSGPLALTARHRLLICYLIDGCGHQSLCDRIWVERPVATAEGTAKIRRRPYANEPLGLLEAAELLRIRKRNARELMTLPIFQREYNAELQRYRDGERAASLRTLVEVRDEPGQNKAADRKVRMQASQVLLGETGGAGASVTVNVGGMPLVAGVVIDMREDDEIEAATRTIEHEDHR